MHVSILIINSGHTNWYVPLFSFNTYSINRTQRPSANFGRLWFSSPSCGLPWKKLPRPFSLASENSLSLVSPSADTSFKSPPNTGWGSRIGSLLSSQSSQVPIETVTFKYAYNRKTKRCFLYISSCRAPPTLFMNNLVKLRDRHYLTSPRLLQQLIR